MSKGFPIQKEPKCAHKERLHTPLEVKLEEFLKREFGIQEHHCVEDEIRGCWGNLYIVGRSREEAEAVYSFTSLSFDEIPESQEDMVEVRIIAPEKILPRINEVLGEYKIQSSQSILS
ncbi:hypothetical protein A2Z23_00515 [Candidatus Curtissbacteria bacterium RBG_16_39_7]|uniref:Uncharacterized protein n=1 Tax=Candidatus Curtissbacteria bacterium RBG_16_39_7 TaxID=1797707 RepID=A0A1F5G2L4_9BACT|nr:MAG: hypothetical protein A2Z23_00515 [Candidatus Curtissbacteria bacterium RBG_16_39_7]